MSNDFDEYVYYILKYRALRKKQIYYTTNKQDAIKSQHYAVAADYRDKEKRINITVKRYSQILSILCEKNY